MLRNITRRLCARCDGWAPDRNPRVFAYPHLIRQSPGLFRSEMDRAIKVLEDVTGRQVLGHRAPFFSITRDSLWAFEVLGELGIRYDSSVFPVLNYRYGIADAPRWPYEVDAGSRSVIEFPISTWQMLGRNVPIARRSLLSESILMRSPDALFER